MTPKPLLFSMFSGRWVSVASLFFGPLCFPLGAVAIFWAMLKSSVPAASLFPLFVVLILSLYLGAGLLWVFGAVVTGTAVALAGFFFSGASYGRPLYALGGVLLWVLFWVLSRFDRRRTKSWNRFQEEWDGLELDLAKLQADGEQAALAVSDSKARLESFHRLQRFTDDLIGPYHRDELLNRAQEGLGIMFPDSKVRLHLFPKPDVPDPRDDWGIKILQWGQPRLLLSRNSVSPTWEPSQFLCLPVKGRESYLGWISLESSLESGLFHVHDLRMASIATDLISLALGNTERFSQTEALAISDELTGLYTRGYFNERLLEEVRKARHNGRPLSLAILDIDHFKKVNDDYGHHMGDEVLRWLSRLVMEQARETDFVARYGGEELVVIMPSTRVGDALRFTQRMCQAIAATPFRSPQKKIKITVSAGVASLTKDLPDEEALIRCADDALYTAKNNGRNRVCSFES